MLVGEHGLRDGELVGHVGTGQILNHSSCYVDVICGEAALLALVPRQANKLREDRRRFRIQRVVGGRHINHVGATGLGVGGWRWGDRGKEGPSLTAIKATEDGLSKKKEAAWLDAVKDLLFVRSLQSQMWNHINALVTQMMY